MSTRTWNANKVYPDLPKLVDAYSRIARKEIRKSFKVNSCIASTRITLRVFKYYGWRGHAVPVSLIVENEKFKTWRESGLIKHSPPTDEAWSVAVGHEDDIGHLVALVGRKYLIDAAIDQAERPHKNILLPPVFYQEAPNFLSDGGLMGTLVHLSARVFLAYLTAPHKLVYQSSPDWLDENRTIPVASRIIELMEPHLK